MKCPICRKEVPPDAPERPFCSERCRLIDLGQWSSEEYRIPAEPESKIPGIDSDDDEE